MMKTQKLFEVMQSEHTKNLIEKVPVKAETILSETNSITTQSNRITWDDFRGLSWIFLEDFT